MNFIWHILRKDLLRFRFVLLGWVLLLAAKYLFLASITGIFGHPSLYWLRQFEFPTPFYLAVVFLPAAIAFFLVASLVFEDPPAGRDPFWVTRPISGTQLFAAKFLFAFLMFVLGPLLAALPWWLACGFGAEDIVPMAGILVAAYLLIVLLGLAMASLTNGYPRYFVWTMAGLAVVLGVHITTPGFGRNTPPAVVLGILAACVAALSLEIACHRFIVRHFGKVLPVTATLTLLGSAIFSASPPAALGRLFTPAAPTFPDEENVRVTVAGDVRTFGNGGLSLPLRIDGLPDNAVPILWMDATWRSPHGKVWTIRGNSGGRQQQSLRRAAGHLLGLTGGEVHPPVLPVNFAIAPKYAGRIAAEATSVEGHVRLYTSTARLRAEVPAGPGSWRFDGGSFTVSDFTAAPGDISFVFTMRGSHSAERWWGIGYVALLNRRTHEIIEPSIQDQRASGPHLFNDVIHVSMWMRFKIPDSKWLGESNLVVVSVADGHDLNVAVPLYARSPNHPASLFPNVVSVPAEILQQYAGIYRPRPGATLVIRVKRGNLEGQEPGFIRMGMLPESDSRFYAPNQDWLFAGNDGFHLEFVRDAGGRVTHFVVHQDGRDFIVPRLPDKK